ncbi:ROK family protein [Phenylobacterium montanum]|uniref:ROK family protein n=1 Tax=Phenylobacterium montanum TaxID=2823693 RepID=A0A975FZK9_9CAUL|nr:ROK family protein [Caulobacter sp. S6]QUD88180.1 ROK family protein [Caulobacter sp. S6]
MIRIGVDFGGTKIEAAALDVEGRFQARVRAPNPREYQAAMELVRDLVAEAERQAGATGTVGVGMPGSISPRTGRIRNANSTWLNDRPFAEDLPRVLGRLVRLANDANCLALSEAVDGAGAGERVVFAVIIGTGCGAGLVVDGRLVEGRNGVAAEIGHMALPWPAGDELPAPACWCGRQGCNELYVSGSGFEASYLRAGGQPLAGPAIVAALREGEPRARAVFERYVDRLGRAPAAVCDVVDPDVIVLGGGMSNVDELYPLLPAAIAPHVFSDCFDTPVRKAAHGDSSGVRGAAWLWPPPERGA